MSEPSVSFASAGDARVPKTYLGLGLIATALCFLPLGLITLYYGFRVGRAVADGDQERAMHDSHLARGWLAATIVIGLLIYLFIAAVLVLLGAFSE